MKISRVLLATKTTLLELGEAMHAAMPLKRLIVDGDPLVAEEEPGHIKTVEARELVRKIILEAGATIVEWGEKPGRRPGKIPDSKFDLVVVVGGDGTVLDVSRFVGSIPVLAVNSSPSTSTGHFCVVTAAGFPAFFDAVLNGTRTPASLARLAVSIDGRRFPQPALNDALFANVVPSATSRYMISVGDVTERQKSSGVWISTAAGSTGAILSAGGMVQEITDLRIQYRVREPFGCFISEYGTDDRAVPDGGRSCYELNGGMLGPEGIQFVSRMIKGGVYLDGRRTAVPVDFGSRVSITSDGPPLNLFVRRHQAATNRSSNAGGSGIG